MARINYEIPDEVHKAAKKAAVDEGITLREWIIRRLAGNDELELAPPAKGQ